MPTTDVDREAWPRPTPALFALGLALVACKTPNATVESSTGEAPPTFVEAEQLVVDDTKPPDSSESPVTGLDYWARPQIPVGAFVDQLKASGLELRHEVEVHDTPELIAALKSNTLIWLHPGRYLFNDSDKIAEHNGERVPDDWSRLSAHYDGNQIHDLHDIAFIGLGPRPAVIIQPDGYAPVLSFVDVKGLAMYNLALGHRPEQGFCMGDVLRAVECQDVLIAGTTLFGSGTEGLSLVSVDKLSLRDSVITDCSEQFSTISNSRDIRYERVQIAGNRGDLLRGFGVYLSTLTLDEVEIVDNHPLQWESADSYDLLFAVDGYDFGEWFVDSPRPLEPPLDRSVVELRATSIDGQGYERLL